MAAAADLCIPFRSELVDSKRRIVDAGGGARRIHPAAIRLSATATAAMADVGAHMDPARHSCRPDKSICARRLAAADPPADRLCASNRRVHSAIAFDATAQCGI